MRNLLLRTYIFLKYLFGTKLVLEKQPKSDIPTIETKQESYGAYQLRRFLEIFDINKEYEVIIHTPEVEEHFRTNYRYLDGPEGLERIAEQQGLIYEMDGKTPKNPSAIYDFTYEEYKDYKETILPIARNRKITEEEIKEFIDSRRHIAG